MARGSGFGISGFATKSLTRSRDDGIGLRRICHPLSAQAYCAFRSLAREPSCLLGSRLQPYHRRVTMSSHGRFICRLVYGRFLQFPMTARKTADLTQRRSALAHRSIFAQVRGRRHARVATTYKAMSSPPVGNRRNPYALATLAAQTGVSGPFRLWKHRHRRMFDLRLLDHVVFLGGGRTRAGQLQMAER
jgi:hypothetical protein